MLHGHASTISADEQSVVTVPHITVMVAMINTTKQIGNYSTQPA